MRHTFTLALNAKFPHTDDGQQISALARAAGLSSFNEICEMNFDYLDESMRGAFDEIDHEDALIDALNEFDKLITNDPNTKCTFDTEIPLPEGTLQAFWTDKNNNLLLGAWLALNRADDFTKLLAEWKSFFEANMHDTLGDYSLMPEPYKTELSKAHEQSFQSLWHGFLHGDRSDLGLLGLAAKKLFGSYSAAEIDYDQKTDAVTVEMDDEQLRDYLIDNTGGFSYALESWLYKNCPEYRTDGSLLDGFPLPPDDLVAASLSENLNAKIEFNTAKQKRELERQRAEREKTRAYQDEQAKLAELRRREKLEKMTRE